jgi:NADH-quinone oxidoreductase subunit E
MSGTELGMPAVPAKGYPQEVRDRLDRDADAVISRYPVARSALLPLLHLVQAEEGHVSADGIKYCAEKLGLSTADVSGVATFYSMYKRHEVGDYLVGVCTNTLCAVLGGDEIFAALKEHLGVDNDQRTAVSPEGRSLTLEHIECNAACDYAPMMTVNWEFFDNMTPDKAKALVDDLLAGRPAVATRGPAVCSFRETERILAGFEDRRQDAVHAGGSAGPESVVGLKIAQQRGEYA